MRTFGLLFLIVGPILVLVAFGMNTSVTSYGGAVNNLGLLQQQMMVLQTGLAIFIAGAVLCAGGSVHENRAGQVVNRNASARLSEEAEEGRRERLIGDRAMNRTIGLSLFGLVVLIIVVIIIEYVK